MMLFFFFRVFFYFFFYCFLCTAWFAGYFSGQTGYGYRSFEAFIDAVRQIEAGSATAEVRQLTVAVLEAGRFCCSVLFRFQRTFCVCMRVFVCAKLDE